MRLHSVFDGQERFIHTKRESREDSSLEAKKPIFKKNFLLRSREAAPGVKGCGASRCIVPFVKYILLINYS